MCALFFLFCFFVMHVYSLSFVKFTLEQHNGKWWGCWNVMGKIVLRRDPKLEIIYFQPRWQSQMFTKHFLSLVQGLNCEVFMETEIILRGDGVPDTFDFLINGQRRLFILREKSTQHILIPTTSLTKDSVNFLLSLNWGCDYCSGNMPVHVSATRIG